MDSKIVFEMSFIIVEAIRGRCASFMVLTSTVSEIFGGQTNSSILVTNIDYNSGADKVHKMDNMFTSGRKSGFVYTVSQTDEV